MSELAERSGVSAATIKHYLREGLLPEPVKTSRNMAYYPPEFVARLRTIKRLQEERYLPLRVIRELLGEGERVPRSAVADRLPDSVLDRLGEIGVLSEDARGYGPEDVRIIDAIARFRAGGYDERLGFTVYDTLRYVRALEPLVREEVAVLVSRLEGEERAAEIVAAGTEPLRELIGAIHSKLLLDEFRSASSASSDPGSSEESAA
jgi:DNA-binding transcriptional MerR regulator